MIYFLITFIGSTRRKIKREQRKNKKGARIENAREQGAKGENLKGAGSNDPQNGASKVGFYPDDGKIKLLYIAEVLIFFYILNFKNCLQ